jgi:flavin-dependent dehydrogenase
MRRAHFDNWLLDHARSLGITVIRDHIKLVKQDAHGVLAHGRAAYSAELALVAGGANAVHLGQSTPIVRHRALAIRGYAQLEDRRPQIVMIPGRGLAYAWAFPTVDGLMNFGFGYEPERWPETLDRQRLLFAARELLNLDKREAHGAINVKAAFLPLDSGRKPAARGRVLVAGDAASLVNPISGEGIHWAVVSGVLAGLACEEPRGAARQYSRRLNRHLRAHRLVTGGLYATSRNASLHSAAFDIILASESTARFGFEVAYSGGALTSSVQSLSRCLETDGTPR